MAKVQLIEQHHSLFQQGQSVLPRVPLVTVLMAVHNGEKYLRESLESILAQSFMDFEFLIIDDGSTDQSRQIISSYEGKDPRIRVIDNEHNIGLTRSLNLGIAEARGMFIARQDADDASMPCRLGAQVDILNGDPNIALVSSWCELIDRDGNLFGFMRPPQRKAEIIQRFFFRDSPLAHGSMLFRKETVVRIGGYDERFWYAQDFDLWLRVLREEKNDITVVPQPLYRLRKLPPESPFKSICQRRYAELSLQQAQLGGRLEFMDVREWAVDKFPHSRKPDRDLIGEYWLFLALTALFHSHRRLAWYYAIKAISSPSLLMWSRAVWRILLSTLPRRAIIWVTDFVSRLHWRRGNTRQLGQ